MSSSKHHHLRLFGFELNPKPNQDGGFMKKKKKNKLECEYCFKEFANAQALGGHQNAHKKERLKKKKMELEQIGHYDDDYYLQRRPYNLQQQHDDYHDLISSSWQISFSSTGELWPSHIDQVSVSNSISFQAHSGHNNNNK